MSLAAPVLSLCDPLESGEGSIDPLQLQNTYEQLAERIFPFMAVRMSRPRYLTAIAVAARVCEGLEEELASDGKTPAWLVCEWYVVEAFVRREDDIPATERWGLPGTTKVRRALSSGRRVAAAAYLKTPKVFGYTGVYKTLAIGLQITTEELEIDEGANGLLRTWEREQGLGGFLDGSTGPGADFRTQLRHAVEAGLRKGYTDRPGGWALWDQLVAHLRPDAAGRREADWLYRRLIDPNLQPNPRDPEATRMRQELLARLARGGYDVDTPALTSGQREATFFRATMADTGSASRDLIDRLRMIDAYEALCRPIEDALALIRHLSTERGPGPVDARDFARSSLGQTLASRIPGAIRRVEADFVGTNWEAPAVRLIERFGGVSTASGLFDAVIEHHYESQRAKPPDGKRPWIEPMPRGQVIVRQDYLAPEPPPGDDSYVRDYRTATAVNFLRDLGKRRP